MDRISPDIGTGLVRHFIEDVIPYLLCCKAEQFSKCNTFYGKRPSDRGFDFSPPRPPGNKENSDFKLCRQRENGLF